ncbi:MAG: hypothetical protein CHACPFDD_03243 [Phycisphaerae bacterium]|nr:hypothetical protein [Phycisphaerae bacterium]
MAKPRPARAKHDIVTFKADRSLLEALRGIENRSEFIRAAVMAALEHVCPLCKGSGILTPNQKTHWTAFAAHHSIRECGGCHELYLHCAERRTVSVHGDAS